MKIVKRDLEIIEYLLEMKQGSISQIKNRFFNGNQYLEGTSKRLKKLTEAGLLKFNKTSKDSKTKYYFPTLLGFAEAINETDKVLPPPIKQIHRPTLEHDLLVSEMRESLEKKEIATNWISERTIIYLQKKGFIEIDDNYIPDGIATIEGQRTSIEVERTLKSQKRIREKVFDLYFYMNRKSSLFKRCQVYCSSSAIFSRYKLETSQYESYFEIKKLIEEG